MKLLALDEEDLGVVSAMVQDSLMKVGDIRYLPAEKRLMISMNRFAWDADKGHRAKQNERRRAVLSVARVDALRAINIDRSNLDGILSLLAVVFEPGEAPGGRIEFKFSGGAALSADVECIEVQLADLGASWATDNRPFHSIEE